MSYDALKTRVSELEVINNLYRETNADLQQRNENARLLLDQSQAREVALKRRVDQLEREIAELRDPEPRSKRQRLSDSSDYPDR